MSKSTPKQRYTQLISWLISNGIKKETPKTNSRFSKADHRNKVNKRYGAKSN